MSTASVGNSITGKKFSVEEFSGGEEEGPGNDL